MTDSRMLRWPIDRATKQAAEAHQIQINRAKPACQAAGFSTYAGTWNNRVKQPAEWPEPLRSTPEQIIAFFGDGHYTQGLAMVVSWGRMWRQPVKIYGASDQYRTKIPEIETTLRNVAKNIQASCSITDAWVTLTGGQDGQLRWSAVITSKTLHFLCRSLGFEQNPPVAIDGAVIRRRLWPKFRKSITSGTQPGDWKDDSFEAYCRYMTAISVWADKRGWTTTQVEATIFRDIFSIHFLSYVEHKDRL